MKKLILAGLAVLGIGTVVYAQSHKATPPKQEDPNADTETQKQKDVIMAAVKTPDAIVRPLNQMSNDEVNTFYLWVVNWYKKGKGEPSLITDVAFRNKFIALMQKYNIR